MQKIKVSLIGYGYWGPKLARNFQNSNFFKAFIIDDETDLLLTIPTIPHIIFFFYNF